MSNSSSNGYMAGETSGTRFVEFQTFAPWVYFLLLSTPLILLYMLMVAPSSELRWTAVGSCSAVLLTSNLLMMRTVVGRRSVTITFGWYFTMYRRQIPLTEIATANAVVYDPIGEYGGWGIRGLGKNRALNAQGNRGVRVTLRNGDTLLIGSQRADELADALQKGIEEQSQWA